MKNYGKFVQTMNMEEIKNSVAAILHSRKADVDIQQLIPKLIQLIDLTTLEATDNKAKITALCNKARTPITTTSGEVTPAAVCVYPVFVAQAAEELRGTGVKIAAVAGGFPSGQMPIHLRLAEVEWTVQQGADEIDMVISRGRLLEGDEDFVRYEIEQHKKACGTAHLKVILETGELQTPDLIYRASIIAMEAGADFIKTSTGKISPAATLDAAYIMLNAISEFHKKTGKKVGFKPAGGITTPDAAIDYYLLVEHILGDRWLHPDLFRIGASRLYDALLNAFK